MARMKKATSSAEIDWYLISIDRLKKLALSGLVIVLGIGSYAFYYYQQNSPRNRAERALSDAQISLDTLAASRDLNSFREDFDRASAKLDQARTLFSRAKYAEAESVAIESQTITQAALSRLPGQRDSDAQFLTVEGEVLYQKEGGDWKRSEVRTPLFNGDWVKTGPNSSAELMFANGSLYTIGPSALLEIYSLFGPGSSKKQNTVKMQIGSIEIATHEDISTIRTPGTQVVVDSQSMAQVGVDSREQGTEIVNLKGSSRVNAGAGSEGIQLTAGEQVAATKEGALSAVTKVVPAPALQGPADNQVFQAANNLRVKLEWAPEAQASGYQLQVSGSRLFTVMQINSRRTKTSATTQISSEGLFYWRVASIDSKGRPGVFSPFRRFRVTGLGSSLESLQSDKIAPSLVVQKPFRIGGQFYLIEGKAEPGASVFISDEELLDVGTDGSFKKLISLPQVGWNTVVVKAVDLAGNQSVQRQKVYAEE
ncbi:MAG: hypothetical protein ABI718_04540 [Acidobacteriota bacterium]